MYSTPTALISNEPGNPGFILPNSTELVSSRIQNATAKITSKIPLFDEVIFFLNGDYSAVIS
jgi:hypothetical protein